MKSEPKDNKTQTLTLAYNSSEEAPQSIKVECINVDVREIFQGIRELALVLWSSFNVSRQTPRDRDPSDERRHNRPNGQHDHRHSHRSA